MVVTFPANLYIIGKLTAPLSLRGTIKNGGDDYVHIFLWTRIERSGSGPGHHLPGRTRQLACIRNSRTAQRPHSVLRIRTQPKEWHSL